MSWPIDWPASARRAVRRRHVFYNQRRGTRRLDRSVRPPLSDAPLRGSDDEIGFPWVSSARSRFHPHPETGLSQIQAARRRRDALALVEHQPNGLALKSAIGRNILSPFRKMSTSSLPWGKPDRRQSLLNMPVALKVALHGNRRTQESPPRVQAGFVKIIPAATYSPTHLRMQYHRRWQA